MLILMHGVAPQVCGQVTSPTVRRGSRGSLPRASFSFFDDAAVAERQAAGLATSRARDARKAARATETARLQAEAIRQAAEEVARKAAAGRQGGSGSHSEAERKVARDARYAARKARQR
jgi:hypothetical protein